MELDAKALRSSIFLSIFVFSIYSCSFICVSIMLMLEVLSLSRRVSYGDNLDIISVSCYSFLSVLELVSISFLIWRYKVCICVSLMLSFFRQY